MTVPPRGHRQHTWHSSEVPGAPVEKCIPPWNWQKCCMYTVRCCSRSCFMACEAHMRHGGWSLMEIRTRTPEPWLHPPPSPPNNTSGSVNRQMRACLRPCDLQSGAMCCVFVLFILGSRMMMLGRGGRFVPRFIKGFMNSGLHAFTATVGRSLLVSRAAFLTASWWSRAPLQYYNYYLRIDKSLRVRRGQNRLLVFHVVKI